MHRVALITGASAGIGRATALALAASNDWTALVLSARREPDLNRTAELCKEANAEVGTLVVAGDVSKEEDVRRLFECAVEKFGRVDLLFNNAGRTGPGGPIESTPLQEFMDTLSVNLIAAFLCTREALRAFKSQSPPGGRIINNGSLAAHVPRPHGSSYSISKHAMLGLTKSTALEGRAYGIAVTQIDIGNAMTDMAALHSNIGALQPDGSIRTEPTIDVQHVAKSIVHIAGLPLDVTVLEMNVMATNMPYVGRG